jgi:hypothetical protein
MSNYSDSSDHDLLYHIRNFFHLIMISSTISARCIIYKEVKTMQRKKENRGGSSKVGKATTSMRESLLRRVWQASCWRRTISARTQSTLHPAHFRRWFRMHRSLFEKTLEDLVEANPWFEQKKDALLESGRFFAASIVNLSASNVGLWNFGGSAWWTHQNGWIDYNILYNLKVFCNSIISRYGTEYSRARSYKGWHGNCFTSPWSKGFLSGTSCFIGFDAVRMEEFVPSHHTVEYFKEKMESLLLLLLIVDFGSGTHGLEFLVLTTISLFWIFLRFPGIWKLEGLLTPIKFTISNKEHNLG